MSAEVAVIEIAVAALEVDAFFVAHYAWEWGVEKGCGEARRREGGCGSWGEGEVFGQRGGGGGMWGMWQRN